MKLSEVKDYTLGVLRGAFKNKNILDKIDAEGTKLSYQGKNLGDSYLFAGTESYSEEEQVVGRWIDGKPIYKRSFKIEGHSTGQYTIDVANAEFIVNYDTTWYGNSDLRISSNYWNSTQAYSHINKINTDSIVLYLRHGDAWAKNCVFTIYYTKTTDLPGSDEDLPSTPAMIADGEVYSTDELIVGQWIDGKPLYRKTIEHIGANNTFSFDTNQLNCDFFRITDCSLLQFDGEFISQFYYTSTYFLYAGVSANGNMYISAGSASNYKNANNKYYITVEYTKTTDEPTDLTLTPTFDTIASEAEIAEVFK